MTRARRILLAAAVGAGSLAAGWTAAPATAATAPTLTAPSTVAYYTNVAISGTTPKPNQHVLVYLKTAAGSYHAVRDLHSDASRHFATKIRAGAQLFAFARAGSVNSAVRTIRIRTASCTTSRVFAALPFPASPRPEDYDFAEATATYNGAVAGSMYQSHTSTLRVYERLKGHNPTILGTYRYLNTPFAVPGSTHVVAITKANAVVAAIQDPRYHPKDLVDALVRGEYWLKGRSHLLRHSTSWTSWVPVAVSDTGQVAGWVSTGHGSSRKYYAALWPSLTAKPKVLGQISTEGQVIGDGAGDVAWQSTNGYGYVRTRDGVAHRLSFAAAVGGDDAWEFTWLAASKTAIYAHTQTATVAFRFGNTTPGGPVAGVAVAGSPDLLQVGPDGSLLLGDLWHPYLITAAGARVSLPATYHTLEDQPAETPGWSISSAGSVTYTAATDKRVHVLTCR